MYNEMMDTIGLVNTVDPELAAAMDRELNRQRQNKVIADCIADCIWHYDEKKDEISDRVLKLTRDFPLYQ